MTMLIMNQRKTIKEMSKVIHALYDDDEKLLDGVKALRSSDIHIVDVYSPFPVHGLDIALGIPKTRLAICAFIYAMTGFVAAATMMWYMMIVDWPMNIGGKPSFSFIENLPAFVPILFEASVFCAAHGMVITFLLRSWILPGVSNKNPDPRTTDDLHLVELDLDDKEASEAVKILKSSGAKEINEK